MTGFQELSKEPHRSKAVPRRLDQNINHSAVLIDRSPKIMLHAVDLEEDLVQKPFVAQLGPSSLQLGSVGSTKVFAPTTDGFVAHLNASECHHQFHFA